jgi:hypothetical protein
MYNSGNSSKNVRGSNIIDGTVETVDIADDAVTVDKLANAINTDIATGVSGSTTAGDALPKAGGTMTGTIAGFTSTGIDDNATSTAITIDASENVALAGNMVLTNASSPQIELIDTTNTCTGRLVTTNTNFRVGTTSAHSLAIQTMATDAVVIDTSQNVSVSSGNLKIGTAGKGIDFSAADTALAGTTANILDDYEEGTWTVGGTNVASFTGYYTKIGRMVYCTGKATASGGSIITISGLPFASAALGDYCGGGHSFENNQGETSAGFPIQINNSNTTFLFIDGNAAQSFGDTKYAKFYLWYMAA